MMKTIAKAFFIFIAFFFAILATLAADPPLPTETFTAANINNTVAQPETTFIPLTSNSLPDESLSPGYFTGYGVLIAFTVIGMAALGVIITKKAVAIIYGGLIGFFAAIVLAIVAAYPVNDKAAIFILGTLVFGIIAILLVSLLVRALSQTKITHTSVFLADGSRKRYDVLDGRGHHPQQLPPGARYYYQNQPVDQHEVVEGEYWPT